MKNLPFRKLLLLAGIGVVVACSSNTEKPADPRDAFVGTWNGTRECLQGPCGGSTNNPSTTSVLVIISKSTLVDNEIELVSTKFAETLYGTVSGSNVIIQGVVSPNYSGDQFSGSVSGNSLALTYNGSFPGSCTINGIVLSTTVDCTYNLSK